MNQFTIIQDTREQVGWSFDMYEQCKGIHEQKLDEGDYTIKELFDLEQKTGRKIIRIERKKSTAELAANLGVQWERFCNELERLQAYEHKAIILEFSVSLLLSFPQGSGIPKSRWFRKNKQGKIVRNIKMSGQFMMGKIEKIRTEYNIPVIFAGNTSGAEAEAMELFNRVYDANKTAIQT